MSSDYDKIDALKIKLKNVTKAKLCKEREVLKLRNRKQILSEELNTVKAEINYFSEQLENFRFQECQDQNLEKETLKKRLTQSRHQISKIEICASSEDVKITVHKDVMNAHLEGFQQLFDKEQMDIENRIKEQREKEEKLLELLQQKDLQILEENKKRKSEIAAIEKECETIEQDCAVLKKRNTAMLLKLRKKLLETENLRRERIRRHTK